MAKEWTDEEVQNEIREAVRIVREDKFELFARGVVKPTEPGNNPPPSGPGNDPPKTKKSLWWGEATSE